MVNYTSFHYTDNFDSKYYSAVRYDQLNPYLPISTLYNQSLNINDLSKAFDKYLTIVEPFDRVHQRHYKSPITKYLKYQSLKKNDNIYNFQIIMALNESIPIWLDSPSRIYLKDKMYRSIGREKRFECSKCKKVCIQYNTNDECLYINPTQRHSESCSSINAHESLIFTLFQQEIYQSIANNDFNQQRRSIRSHYNDVVYKYTGKIPILDATNFRSYRSQKSTLQKHRKITA